MSDAAASDDLKGRFTWPKSGDAQGEGRCVVD